MIETIINEPLAFTHDHTINQLFTVKNELSPSIFNAEQLSPDPKFNK